MMCSTIAFQKICFLSLRLRHQSLEYQISLSLSRLSNISFYTSQLLPVKGKARSSLKSPPRPMWCLFVFSTGALNVAALSSQPEPWDTIKQILVHQSPCNWKLRLCVRVCVCVCRTLWVPTLPLLFLFPPFPFSSFPFPFSSFSFLDFLYFLGLRGPLRLPLIPVVVVQIKKQGAFFF